MIPPTFRRLEVFVAAVEAGSFRLCAEHLGIAQPSVSLHIKSLERQLGFALFARRRGAVSGLTDQGGRFYRQARDLLDQARDLCEPAGSRTAPRRTRTIRIGAHGYIAGTILSRSVAGFAADHPDLSLSLEVGTYHRLLELLNLGDVDLAYFFDNGAGEEIESVEVWREAGGFYVGAGHPLARRKRLAASELDGAAFVGSPVGSRFRDIMAAAFAALGIRDYSIVFATDDMNTLMAATRLNIGIGCFYHRCVAEEVAAGQLARLPIDTAPLSTGIRQALSPRRRLDRIVIGLADHLRDTAIAALGEDDNR